MNAAAAVLGLLLPAFPAWLLLGRIEPLSSRDVATQALRAGLAVLLGAGAGAVLAYAALVAGVTLGRGYALGDAALWLAALAVAWRAGRRRGAPAAGGEGAPREAPFPLELAAFAVAAVAIAAVVAAFARYAWMAPHGDWDAWAIWNHHARFLYRGGAAWRAGFSPELVWSHPDYPVLVPAAIARLWAYSAESRAVPAIVSGAFVVAGLVVVFGAVARLRGAVAGACAAALLAASDQWIVWGAAQGGDVPAAALLAGACAALLVASLPGPHRVRLVAVAGALLALCGWTKDEGLMFAALLGGWTLLRAGRAGAPRAAAALAAGAAVPALVWAHFRFAVAPGLGNVISGGGGVADYLARLVDPGRWQVILAGVPKHLPGDGGRVALYALLAAALLGARPRSALRSPVLVPLLASFAAFLVVYAITPLDLGYHVTTSAPRVLLQPWPALLMALLAIGPRAPDASAGAGAVAPRQRRSALSSL